MSSNNIHAFFLISMVWFLTLINNEYALEFRANDCSNATTFQINSTYQSNLNHLLSTLKSKANSSDTTGFYSTTFGKEPETEVHGSFLCRGDLPPDVCENCVKTAVKMSTDELCPIEKVAIIWYDECMLRYSSASYASKMDIFPGYLTYNIFNVSDNSREGFEELMRKTVKELVETAIKGGKRFATKEVKFPKNSTLYNLIQCSPDLSIKDCIICLEYQIDELVRCCGGKQGASAMNPYCNIRYEDYQFYNITATSTIHTPQPSPSPGHSPPTPSHGLSPPQSKGKVQVSSTTIIAICIPVAFALLLLSIYYYFIKKRVKHRRYYIEEDENVRSEIATIESLQFDLATILIATCNFSIDKKLGEGGFGEVFKGVLPNGKEVAIKRFSRGSRQGAREFKNEAILVAKLQHRNLVKILGFCLERKENILVYEYVLNKSLNFFLFDVEEQTQLDWARRYKIICGIARGILYLHEDAPLKIIHLDLKSSNILLDGEMNPKISDFGMARILGIDQTQGSASKIAGTYGYMAPEYAYNGQFTVKSDVYSFGVLILEIISGKKNTHISESGSFKFLLNYAWKHWRDGTPMELLHSNLRDLCSRNEVIRCIHIGLLCVQEDPTYRPTMNSIVLMLNSYSVQLPIPKKPPFLLHGQIDRNLSSVNEIEESYTINEISISEMYPR